MEINEVTLLWLVRIIFFLFVLLFSTLLWEYLRRDRYIEPEIKPEYQVPKGVNFPEKIVVLLIKPKPGHFFDSIKLFDMLYRLGLSFSEHNVFEYVLPDKKTIAFSLINSRNNGVFNRSLTRLNIDGLLAVMQFPIAETLDQVQYFHLLLSVLEEIRLENDATLCDRNGNSLKTEKLFQIQSEIQDFEQKYLEIIQKYDEQRTNTRIL